MEIRRIPIKTLRNRTLESTVRYKVNVQPCLKIATFSKVISELKNYGLTKSSNASAHLIVCAVVKESAISNMP